MGGGSSNTAREAHIADRWVSSFYKRRPLVAGEDVRAAARSPALSSFARKATSFIKRKCHLRTKRCAGPRAAFSHSVWALTLLVARASWYKRCAARAS